MKRQLRIERYEGEEMVGPVVPGGDEAVGDDGRRLRRGPRQMKGRADGHASSATGNGGTAAGVADEMALDGGSR